MKLSQKEKNHIYDLTYNHEDWNGIFNPPMKAQVAVDELCRFFLGENWYDYSGEISPEQVNTEIVYEIEEIYSHSHFRKHQYKKGT